MDKYLGMYKISCAFLFLFYLFLIIFSLFLVLIQIIFLQKRILEYFSIYLPTLILSISIHSF